MRRHIAVDLGASGGRVALGTISDGRLEVEVVHRFPNGGITKPDGLYWDLDALWREIRHGLSVAGQRGEIASVGVNSWGVDYALLDEDDRLIDGIHHYRDPRTDGVMEELFTTVPREDIYKRTGIQFMALNTIFQLVSQRETLKRAKRLLFVPDLFHSLLSGRKVTELTIASTSQLFDPHRRDWDWKLIELCGLPAHLFGEIVEPGIVIGDVLSQIGLPGAKVVAPAAHDTASAVAAVPAEAGSDWAYISSGTWSLAGVESPTPVISDRTLELNLTNEAGINGTTRLLKNIVGLWILQECRRSWGDPDYADLYAESEAASCQSVVDPDDARFLQPNDQMPQQVQAFCSETGQQVPQTRGEITRCVLESLARRSADVLDQLESVTGNSISTVHIVGGGSQIRFLNRLIEERSGRTVVAGPVDATLIGNLLVQAEALGSILHGSIREVVRRSI